MNVINEPLTSLQRVAMHGAMELLTGNHREPSPEWEKQATRVIYELGAALTTAPVDQQGEPVAWASIKPSSPGAYWVRGNGLERDALIEIIEDEGELRCNLHQRTTETDFGYGYSIEQLSAEFEWYGPLTEQAAPVAVVMPELDEYEVTDLAGSAYEEAMQFGFSQEVFARLIRTVRKRTLNEVAKLNEVKV